MRKLLKLLVIPAAAVLLSATQASAFIGGWGFVNTPYAPEALVLGDSSDGTGLYLSGTERYCGRPGSSYARVREVLQNNGMEGQEVYWTIANDCDDGYVRVCVQNDYGQQACSTYRNHGWDDY